MIGFGRVCAALALAFAIGAMALSPAMAKSEQQKVDEAASVIRSFLSDPNFAGLRQAMAQARAVMIIPRFEPGFWGVDGDDDAVLVVQREDGTWSYPAFYDIDDGSVTRGFWSRGSSVVLLVMNDRALDMLLNAYQDVRIGAHLTVAVGSAGNAAPPSGVDLVSYARTYQGYSGASVAGADLEVDKGDNQDYYGYGANPRGITIENRFRNGGADNLRNAMIGR